MNTKFNSNIAKIIIKLIFTIVMLGLGVFLISPLIWMLSSSVKLPAEVFEYPFKLIPENIRWQNYLEVWTNKSNPFYLFYFNSFKVAALSIVGVLVVCSTAAYAFARINFKGKEVIFTLFMATMMIPPQVTLIPRFAMFRWMNIYNTHWSLILPSMFYVVGIFLLRQFYRTIPIELSEAALIDGASHFRIFTQIMLPLTKTGMVSLIILKFVASWNEYMDPLIFLTKNKLYTIPLGMQIYMDSEGQQLQLVMAAASLSIIPLVILFMIFQKYFIQGIATSGLKG